MARRKRKGAGGRDARSRTERRKKELQPSLPQIPSVPLPSLNIPSLPLSPKALAQHLDNPQARVPNWKRRRHAVKLQGPQQRMRDEQPKVVRDPNRYNQPKPVLSTQPIDARLREQTKRDEVQFKQKEETNCKKKPTDNRGAGNSRAFVPWCKK